MPSSSDILQYTLIHVAITLFMDTSAIFALCLYYNTTPNYFMTMCMYSALRLRIQRSRKHDTIEISCVADPINDQVLDTWMIATYMSVYVIIGDFTLVQNTHT